jgi:hypothetical protein
MNLRFENLLTEALHAQRSGHEGKAASLLDAAKAEITPKVVPYAGPPENDPNRTEADRQAWRAAKGA